ncbi:MAG: acyl-CoA dehydrogenase family protein [Candidatus Binatia bacterium]
MLQDQTRRLVREELEPASATIDATGHVPASAVSRLKELGYFGITIPQKYGGLGLGTFPYCLILEELAQSNGAYFALLSGNNGIGSRGIVLEGTETQRQRYLPPMARGDCLAAFALTEPEAGSDAANIQTTALPRDDGYVLNGTKHFITRGDIANVVTVLAVTDKTLRARGGITAFIVERGTPGFRVGQIQESIAGDVVHQCELVFEDCYLPRPQILGQVGFGFAIAMRTLEDGRLTLGAVCLGIAEKLLQLMVAHATQRVTFGKPLARRQLVQAMIADTATEISATRALLYQSAWKRDQGQAVARDSSMVKLFASEMVNRAADRAFQIFGGLAYMKECAVGRIYAGVRVLRIVEGASEIQRMIIARQTLDESRQSPDCDRQ